MLDDALALQEAGCFAIVFEAIPSDVTDAIMPHLEIPVIGIGAGPSTDGQVLVLHDLLTIHDDFKPKFAKRFANLGDEAVEAIGTYVAQVRSGAFPAAAQTYKPNAAPRRTDEGRVLRRDLGLDLGDLDTPLPLDHWH